MRSRYPALSLIAQFHNSKSELNKNVTHDFLVKHSRESCPTHLGPFQDSRVLKESEFVLFLPFQSIGTWAKINLTVLEILEILDADVLHEAIALWLIKADQGNHGEFVASVEVWFAVVDLCKSALKELVASSLTDRNEDTWL